MDVFMCVCAHGGPIFCSTTQNTLYYINMVDSPYSCEWLSIRCKDVFHYFLSFHLTAAMHCSSLWQLHGCVLWHFHHHSVYLWSWLDIVYSSGGRDCMPGVHVSYWCVWSVCLYLCCEVCSLHSGHLLKPCVDRQSPCLWMCRWLNGSDWIASPAMGFTHKEPAGPHCLIASVTTTII